MARMSGARGRLPPLRAFLSSHGVDRLWVFLAVAAWGSTFVATSWTLPRWADTHGPNVFPLENLGVAMLAVAASVHAAVLFSGGEWMHATSARSRAWLRTLWWATHAAVGLGAAAVLGKLAMSDVQTGQIPGIWLVMYLLATIGLCVGGRAAAAAVPFISVVMLSATATVPWRYNIYFNPDCAPLLLQVIAVLIPVGLYCYLKVVTT
jgi:hypothetical protein